MFMKRLINNENPIATPDIKILERFIDESIVSKSIKGAFKLPVSTEELDALAERKKPILNNLFGINLTKAKKDKSRDYICQMLLELTGGYQNLQAFWRFSYQQMIETLIEYIDLPDVIYLTIDDQQIVYMCIDQHLNLKHNKRGWDNWSNVQSPEEKDDKWKVLEEKESLALETIYGISQMVVATGGSDIGLGNLEQDTDYIKNQFNYNFIGQRTDYNSFNDDRDCIVLMMTKPKNIDGFIKYLTKKLEDL
jgi:hypothetical protein